MKTDLLFWTIPQPLAVAQPDFAVLLQLTLFMPSSIFLYSSSNPYLAAAVSPLKPDANWKVGLCACLVQDCPELVCVWLWRCHSPLQLDRSGAEPFWGEGMSPCTTQLSSCLRALTGTDDREQVCFWYDGRFFEPCLCAKSLLLLCGHQKLWGWGVQAEMAICRLAKLTLETESFMRRMSDLCVSMISAAFGKGGECGTLSACNLSAHYLSIALLVWVGAAAC